MASLVKDWLRELGSGRFEGEGETEERVRRCSYFLRAEGELKMASWGDLGGQLGGLLVTLRRLGLSLTIMSGGYWGQGSSQRP